MPETGTAVPDATHAPPVDTGEPETFGDPGIYPAGWFDPNRTDWKPEDAPKDDVVVATKPAKSAEASVPKTTTP